MAQQRMEGPNCNPVTSCGVEEGSHISLCASQVALWVLLKEREEKRAEESSQDGKGKEGLCK